MLIRNIAYEELFSPEYNEFKWGELCFVLTEEENRHQYNFVFDHNTYISKECQKIAETNLIIAGFFILNSFDFNRCYASLPEKLECRDY